tara:strand:- start:1882 stop:2373 length:492 start_codon:yes stop_codon:yes gene_type:complete
MSTFSPNRLHNLTYQEITSKIGDVANAHMAINQFDTGTLDYLDANAVNKKYPYVYLRPIVSQGIVDKARGLTFELYSMDVPKLSDESPVEVLSNTEMYIYDIVGYFNYGNATIGTNTPIQQIYQIDITSLAPVNEAFQDRVFGWVATIDVLTPWKWDYCNFPQ